MPKGNNKGRVTSSYYFSAFFIGLFLLHEAFYPDCGLGRIFAFIIFGVVMTIG